MRGHRNALGPFVAVGVLVLVLGGHPAALADMSVRSADDAGTPVIMAVPGSRAGTYATPVVVAEPGDDLTFVNVELFPHDVRSVAMGPDDTRWCNPPDPDEPRHRIRNPRRFPIGKCPLLWSLPITMTVGAVETKVFGTGNLKPGTTVEFYCTVFPTMQGSLIVP
jgi:plastocyanin